MRPIMVIAARHGLAVIEDACEALGAEADGRPVGSLGICGVYGFYPNKQITTGEGGMIVTGNGEVAAECRSLRNHGRDGDADPVEHARLGYNYRLSELACALGLAQMGRLDAILTGRRSVAERYDRQLAGQPDLTRPALEVPDGRPSWFAYVVRLAPGFSRADRDGIVTQLRERGIGCGRYFDAIHLHAHVQQAVAHRRGDFPVAEAASDRTLALPFFVQITDGQLDEVCDALIDLVSRRRRSSTTDPQG